MMHDIEYEVIDKPVIQYMAQGKVNGHHLTRRSRYLELQEQRQREERKIMMIYGSLFFGGLLVAAALSVYVLLL